MSVCKKEGIYYILTVNVIEDFDGDLKRMIFMFQRMMRRRTVEEGSGGGESGAPAMVRREGRDGCSFTMAQVSTTTTVVRQ